jgi:hypothetical protein
MRGSSAVKNWARVHLFRTATAVLTLALLGLCFYYSPDLLTWWLRATMRIIEAVAGLALAKEPSLSALLVAIRGNAIARGRLIGTFEQS